MKYILVLALISFTVPVDKEIPHRPLTYDDFKGTPIGEWAALSTTGINISPYRWKGTFGPQHKGEISFRATAYFVPEKSYLKVRTEKVLAHEQSHFDITEIFARKINATLKNPYVGSTDRAYEIYDSLIVEWNKFQQLYDRETQNSINDSAQQVWNERIKNMLKNYKQ